jgi:competence protein ComEA
MDTNQTARPSFFKRFTLATAALAALALTPVLVSSSAHAAPKAGATASAGSQSADVSSDDGTAGVVNLNTATEAELGLLPGVGPSKASAITAYRKKYGPFKKVDDLNKVKGFGFKTLKKLKPYLTVSGATTYKGKAKKPARGEEAAATASAESP